jgi:hypothetical protein
MVEGIFCGIRDFELCDINHGFPTRPGTAGNRARKVLPADSVLQVITRQTNARTDWVELIDLERWLLMASESTICVRV